MELKGHGRLRKLEGRGTPSASDWPSTNVDRGTWYPGAGYKVRLASCYVDRVKPVVCGIPAGKAYPYRHLVPSVF